MPRYDRYSLGEQPGGNAPDMDKMIEQAAAGQDTAHAIAARIGTHKGITQVIIKEITQASAEIKESVAEFLKTAETKPVNRETPLFTQMLKAQPEQSSPVQASTTAMPGILQAVDVLEQTLNIPKKTLQGYLLLLRPSGA